MEIRRVRPKSIAEVMGLYVEGGVDPLVAAGNRNNKGIWDAESKERKRGRTARQSKEKPCPTIDPLGANHVCRVQGIMA